MTKRILIMTVVLTLLSGCGTFWLGTGHEQTRQGASSSLVDFLYPDGHLPPPVEDRMPYLSLPLRVGIAFVPSSNREDLPATEKQELLERAASAFRDRAYVTSIETIPDNYMRSAHGVHGMKQVAALYDVDVMALVSYDQISFSSERDSALLYWTIVGALAVKGNSNEVQTLIDTAVFDAETAKLLFRAPGVHKDRRNATLVDNKRDLRKLRGEGFSSATDDMIVNLDRELGVFQDAVKNGERAQVEWREGHGGGGGMGLPLVTLLLLVVLAHQSRRWRS